MKRILTKVNYHIHTRAIQDYVLPKLNISDDKKWIIYAEEADLLNVALFGCTAKQWREANLQRHLNGENIRDIASINELTILSNLENLNSNLNKQGVDKQARFDILVATAKEQREILEKHDVIKSLRKETPY